VTAAAAHFSHSYSEARERFLHAARGCGAAQVAHRHPTARGPGGEELAIDVACLGDPRARAALVLSCGTHGVEGFAGSGAMTAWLAAPTLARTLGEGRVRLVLVHAVNPWGFAHDARGDENNVDVNRNFRDFGAPQPRNDGYARLHHLLVPRSWPPRPLDEARLALAALRLGPRVAQAAITRGQCEFADGLFYAGRAPSWSRRTLESIMAGEGAGVAALAWIDLHSGLGRPGSVSLIHNGRNEGAALARARRWFGDAVTSMYMGESPSSEVVGADFAALDSARAGAVGGVTVEFGTLRKRAVLDALRARQWLANQAGVDPAEAARIRARSRSAFYVDQDGWKERVAQAVRSLAAGALAMLARDADARD
jgi:Protein of unknown function (DUF2817)